MLNQDKVIQTRFENNENTVSIPYHTNVDTSDMKVHRLKRRIDRTNDTGVKPSLEDLQKGDRIQN